MKKYLIIIVFIIILFLVGNNFYQTQKAKNNRVPSKAFQDDNSAITSNDLTTSPSGSTPQDQKFPVNQQLTIATINIRGFDCPTCPIGAEYALKDLKGVYDAKVTESGEGSKILYDASVVTVDDMKKILAPFTIEVVNESTSDRDKLN